MSNSSNLRRAGTVAAAFAALATAGSLVNSLAATAAPAPVGVTIETERAESDDLAARFTLAVMPDTQFYSRYASVLEGTYGTTPYDVQAEWLVEHQDELNIPFLTHLGDIVDQVGVESQWRVADRAMGKLEAGDLDYSILPGNHDVRNTGINDNEYTLANEPYARWFPPSRAEAIPTHVGSDPTGFNQAHVFQAEGQQFLVLALNWRTSDQTLAWADQVMADHPTLPTILTTHEILDVDTDKVSPRETPNGLRLWDRLIRSNDQIFMTINGHNHGSTQLTKTNDFGHPVTQILIDWQMAYEGGNGYLSLYEFDLTNDKIRIQTPSPWVAFKPSEKLTYNDRLFLEGVNEQFTLDLDFAERFAGFDPQWDSRTAAPSQPSLYERAREILLDGFVPPDTVSGGTPQSVDDFPVVEGTQAHWRFNTLADGVVAEGQVVPDVAGENDMHRVSIADSLSPTAEVGDVVVTHDVHPGSSDGAAVCFLNSDKIANRYSYLSTGPDAPVNAETFPNGYTIETFMQISEEFTEDKNAWMKGLVHTGQRNLIPGYPTRADGQTSGTQSLGLSNLKEFQWTEVGSDPTRGDKVNWSGEIPLNHWVHVAIVNDPATQRSILHVDGAPTLRIAENTVGSSISSVMPWIIGAAWSNGRGNNSWTGCIGETRLINHPTTADQWLTARVVPTVALSVDPVSGAPYQDVTLTTTLGGAATDGTLTFRDGDNVLGSVPVVDGEAAAFTTNNLGVGVHTLTVALTDADGATLATSAPVTATYEAQSGEADGTVTVNLPAGTISITTPYTTGNPLNLGAAVLDPADSTYSASAPFEDIVITDSRAGLLGFTASVVSGEFRNAGDDGFGGNHAGLTGLVATQVDGNGLLATDVALTDHAPHTDGLGTPKVFAQYPAGRSIGTAHLDGVFGIDQVPTSVAPGTYAATVTFTVV